MSGGHSRREVQSKAAIKQTRPPVVSPLKLPVEDGHEKSNGESGSHPVGSVQSSQAANVDLLAAPAAGANSGQTSRLNSDIELTESD